MTEPKKARVLKSVRWDAETFEALEVKAKTAGGFNNLLNAIAAEWLGKRPAGTIETTEISARLAAEIKAILAGKSIAKPMRAEPEKLVALAEEIPPVDILDQVSTPKKPPKYDQFGNIILNATAQNFGAVKAQGAKFNGNSDPKYWYVPKDFIAHADMKFFEEWLA